MSSDPFDFDHALKRALDAERVPPLSPGFADRVVAASRTHATPLPQARPAPVRRWRTRRRLVIGAMAAGALATAAAATGLLEELGVELPSPREVWSAVSGQDTSSSPPPASIRREGPSIPRDTAPVIEGPIDSPEELEEVFRRVDEARANRREDRRERVDARLDEALERRRAQGLPAPTPEEEARLRQRLDRLRERADERLDQRALERREALRRQLEEEGKIAPEGGERLRQMPPEERRERLREWRERREQRLREQQSEPAPPASEEPPPSPDR